jgi:HicB_like antitoxin of bacterial toxin-antitoxin system
MRFSVVLHSDDGVRFGVTVPNLPGCFSSGDSFDYVKAHGISRSGFLAQASQQAMRQ